MAAKKESAGTSPRGSAEATAPAGAPHDGELPAVAPSLVVGWLDQQSRVGRLVVDFPDNAAGPQPARSVIRLSADELAHAVAKRQGVLVQFAGAAPGVPIVTGLLQPEMSLLDEILSPAQPAAEASPPVGALPEARVDGKRVVLEGTHEVVLRCGEASITLKRDGKVILKGAYVETHAKGLNRIKGGTVKIN